jgi:hypothetical protein
MDSSLLIVGATLLLAWISGLPLLWKLIRVRPARLAGLKADFLMLVHLALLLLGIGTLIVGSGLTT